MVTEAKERRKARLQAQSSPSSLRSPWTDRDLMGKSLGTSPWTNPGVMEKLLGTSLATGFWKLPDFAALGLVCRNMSAIDAFSKEASAFSKLGLIADLGKLSKSPLADVMARLTVDNPFSQLMNSSIGCRRSTR